MKVVVLGLTCALLFGCSTLNELNEGTPDGGFNVDGGPDEVPTLGEWSQSQHLRMVGLRGTTVLDVSADATNSQMSCGFDGTASSPDFGRPEVEVVGTLAPGLGNITLKFKDYDVTSATVGQQVAQGEGIRIEWELKDPNDTTLCDQSATEGHLEFAAVPSTSGGLFGGIVKAKFPKKSETCPAADIEATFAVECETN